MQPSTLGQPDRIVLAEQAIRSLERAIALDPDNAEAEAQLALARSFLGKTNAEIRGSQEKLQKEMEARKAERAKLLSQKNPNPRQVADIEQQLNALAAIQADMVRKGYWTNESAGAPEQLQPPPTTESGAPEVTYRGKSYSAWAREARTERQETVLLGAVDALPILAKGDPGKEAETAQLICQMMRVHGGVDMNIDFSVAETGSPITMRHSLVIASLAALCRMGPEATTDVLLKELAEGNANSREFVRLACGTDLVVELANVPFVQIDKNDAQRFLNGIAKRADEFPKEWNIKTLRRDNKQSASKRKE